MDKKRILERIYKTKKARMCMEQRLLQEEKFKKNLIVILSIFLIVFSMFLLLGENIVKIFEIKEKYSKIGILILNLLNVSISIGVLVFSVLNDGENRLNRAWMTRLCYTELAKLETANGIEENELNEKYQNILVKYENHTEEDYNKSQIKEKKDRTKLGIRIIIVLLIIILIFNVKGI